MAVVARGYIEQPKIKRAVAGIARKLSPDVVRIRYEIGEDWMGDDAIYFRVLLADQATAKGRLGEVVAKVRDAILFDLDPMRMGLLPYINFRGFSEQEALQDPEWA